MRDLLLAELAPHAAGDGSNVTVDGPPVMLKPQAALFLALVIHELSTNAANSGAAYVRLFFKNQVAASKSSAN